MEPARYLDLVDVVQQLSLTDDVASIQDIVRHAARRLTGADGATFVLREGDACFYADEDAIAPLWKGLRFPLTACISGWAMLNREAVAIEDIYADDRIPHDAYRPTFVRSLAMVPIRSTDPLGAIGNYWATMHLPTREELTLLQALADSTAVAMARADTLAKLERLVAERTEEVRMLSLTDDLTGIANRRGFLVRAEQVRKVSRRRGVSGLLLFVDVDGLKGVNDRLGHDYGDRHIQSTAAVLTSSLREGDVVARWGGDEFVAYLADAGDPQAVTRRLAGAFSDFNQRTVGAMLSVSIGVAVDDPREEAALPDLLAVADASMYREKHEHRASAHPRQVDRQVDR